MNAKVAHHGHQQAVTCLPAWPLQQAGTSLSQPVECRLCNVVYVVTFTYVAPFQVQPGEGAGVCQPGVSSDRDWPDARPIPGDTMVNLAL